MKYIKISLPDLFKAMQFLQTSAMNILSNPDLRVNKCRYTKDFGVLLCDVAIFNYNLRFKESLKYTQISNLDF